MNPGKEGWTGICRLIGEELEREDIQRRRQILDRLRTDFMGHMSRLDYEGRLASGDAIGRGVLEGAAKTLGLRLKTRGARWRHKNARSMAALICGRQTEQWDLFSGQAAWPLPESAGTPPLVSAWVRQRIPAFP